jgi:hypothetical protein
LSAKVVLKNGIRSKDLKEILAHEVERIKDMESNFVRIMGGMIAS